MAPLREDRRRGERRATSSTGRGDRMNDEQATRDAGQQGPLSRRDFLRGSAALGSVLASRGMLGALGGPATALAAGKSGTPKRGGRLSVAIHDGSTTDTLSPW